MSTLIPWAKPYLFGNEADRMQEALLSTWISGGPFVDQLERDLGKFLDSEFVCATSNGTTALHLAFLALGIGQGCDVIIPGFAYLGAANVALLCGARPVFAEVDPDTWCLTADAVQRVLTPQTKAIVAVHTYGNMCDMDSLNALGAKHNIPVIEDAAEALGSTFRGRPAGACSTIGTFSFHATKTITTGEGGLVTTSDKALHERMVLFRSHGMARDLRYYWHQVPGHNFRLTNFQAAMGCAQFEHFPEIAEKRATLHLQYKQRLESQPGLILQKFENEVSPLLWALAVQLDPEFFPQGRDEVLLQMRAAGIECRPGFYAASQQPIYASPALPVCEELACRILSVPFFVGLEEAQVEFISQTLLGLRQVSV